MIDSKYLDSRLSNFTLDTRMTGLVGHKIGRSSSTSRQMHHHQQNNKGEAAKTRPSSAYFSSNTKNDSNGADGKPRPASASATYRRRPRSGQARRGNMAETTKACQSSAIRRENERTRARIAKLEHQMQRGMGYSTSLPEASTCYPSYGWQPITSNSKKDAATQNHNKKGLHHSATTSNIAWPLPRPDSAGGGRLTKSATVCRGIYEHSRNKKDKRDSGAQQVPQSDETKVALAAEAGEASSGSDAFSASTSTNQCDHEIKSSVSLSQPLFKSRGFPPQKQKFTLLGNVPAQNRKRLVVSVPLMGPQEVTSPVFGDFPEFGVPSFSATPKPASQRVKGTQSSHASANLRYLF